MKLKSVFAVMTAGAMLGAMLTGCGGGNNAGADTGDSGAAAGTGEKVTLQIGFENSISEPLGQGLEKWAELVDEKSNGTMEIVLYPDSQLGSKSELIDSMLLGENVSTLADGAFYADYGVPDFGIVFGPFLFDDWDQCWKLIESDWYKEQEGKLEEKGLKLLASNWVYGARHTLTVKPVNTVDDLAGMKIRVPNNEIQSLGFDVLGATSTGMDLGDVYQALQTKTIDGAENPLATLYGRKLHEVAKNLILDGHVLNFTTWVCSADWFNGLTEEQQNILLETGKEAGVYNNEVQAASEEDYLQKMKDEGVTVVEPTEEVLEGFRAKAQSFYDMGDKFGWSDGLYDTVRAAMGAE
ncbi:MAG: C4-dicarboxylate TRAP transporter substrate-binding protein [Eubacteriales bacterium]|nr:C4-dicarboxylate TRAP transporter substrate-binding protein [Eubacteriales bacterium]